MVFTDWLTIYQSHKGMIGKIIYDIETAVILLNIKDIDKINSEGIAEYHAIDTAMGHKKDILTRLLFQHSHQAGNHPL